MNELGFVVILHTLQITAIRAPTRTPRFPPPPPENAPAAHAPTEIEIIPNARKNASGANPHRTRYPNSKETNAVISTAMMTGNIKQRIFPVFPFGFNRKTPLVNQDVITSYFH